MPSRTYVEMFVENQRWIYILKDRLYYMNLLIDAYKYLCKHPEKVEDVVKQRIRVGKFGTKHNSFEWLFLELQIISTWILDERFSGDIVYDAPVPVLPTPFESYGFIPEVRISNANPIYIPKHVRHRKKGRR